MDMRRYLLVLDTDLLALDEKLDLAPGSYEVRFFVRDNISGKIGTVVFPLDVN